MKVRLQACSRILGPRGSSCLGAGPGAGMIEPVLKKAPDLEDEAGQAAIPSTVPRNTSVDFNVDITYTLLNDD